MSPPAAERVRPGQAAEADGEQRAGQRALATIVPRSADDGAFLTVISAEESEAVLLGHAIRYGNADVLDDLTPEDLFDPRHRDVLVAIRSCAAAGPVDPALVLAELRRNGVVPATPDRNAAVLIADLTLAGIGPAGRWHRRSILEARLRRSTREWALRIAQTAGSGRIDDLNQIWRSGLETVAALARRIERPVERSGAGDAS